MNNLNVSMQYFVHCKNNLRNIRVYGNKSAIEAAKERLRQAATECRQIARGHKG